MLKADVFNLKGKTDTKIELPKEIFGIKPNRSVMAQAVRVYLANQRRAGAKTKTRAEVGGSGRKIYRQKGTGRARHGDRYAPIFVGGGIAHGPTGKQNYRRKMSKKLKRLTILSALSAKFQEGKVAVVKDLEKIEPKTLAMANFLKKSNLENNNKKITLVFPKIEENLFRAARNHPQILLQTTHSLNAYFILNTDALLFSPEAIKELKKLRKYA